MTPHKIEYTVNKYSLLTGHLPEWISAHESPFCRKFKDNYMGFIMSGHGFDTLFIHNPTKNESCAHRIKTAK